jgi:hypothetical protein
MTTERWHKILLSRDRIMREDHIRLQSAFQEIFLAHRGPKDAGMFTNTRIEFPATYYLSPGAVRIAKQLAGRYSATECDAPKRSDLTILVARTDLAEIPFADDREERSAGKTYD